MSRAIAQIREPPEELTEVFYPESDGKPMAETDIHRDQMTDLIGALKEYYRNAPDVYVSGNILIYYEEGNPYQSVSPDVLVAFGIPNKQRRIYQTWVEGKAPDLALEVTSRQTKREDLWNKRALYHDLGVREYFLFDPLSEYLQPPLQGFRNEGSEFVPIRGDKGRLESKVLNLEWRVEEDHLRIYDPNMSRYLPTMQELVAQVDALKSELARLRDESSRS